MLAEVLLVNLVLSGDNAVVIGLAARGLEASARKRAIALGGGFAVGLRLALTFPAEMLLKVPFLRAGGGMLLVWIAYRLLAGDDTSEASEKAETVMTAVRLIVLADLTMSLDNILAVAAVAERSGHDILVLAIGLALSIPIVLIGGDVVARLMGRLPLLVWLGSGVLAYTAGELITEDSALDGFLGEERLVRTVLSVLLACAVVGAAAIRLRLSSRKEANPLHARARKRC